MPLEKLHEEAFNTLFKGKPAQPFEIEAKIFIPLLLSKKINKKCLERLRLAQQSGDRVQLLSSSPSFLVSLIAKELGNIPWKSTEYAIDKEGKFCHIAHLMNGYEKAKVIQHLENSVAYSDSIDDLPLLKAASTAVCVSPSKLLLKQSFLNKWEVL